MSDNKRVKPQNPKGTRDFLPQQVARRNYIFDTIKAVFHQYGFQQIETPALERLETLTGKYGDEGDKLLFKILNSGDFINNKPFPISLDSIDKWRNDGWNVPGKTSTWNDIAELAGTTVSKITKSIQPDITEKGLRYDLTVPLARYVVQNQDNIVFPFRRYHIGPVWRADKPQKGRYQEFYQCDADIIGSNSLINEIELTKIYVEVFKALKLDVTIKVNNRKVLEGIVTAAGCPALLTEVTIAIDKLDKIGHDGVRKELLNAGLNEEQIAAIEVFLEADTLDAVKDKFEGNEIGMKGVSEMDYVFNLTDSANVKFDIKLARGLNYYTGVIWEVAANGVQMGSIASGGRYDNLTEMFGGINMSGVGISFGIERIYDVMEELNLFPDDIAQGVTVLFVPRDSSNEERAFKLATIAREEGISAEVFLGKAKKNKHFGYAAVKGIRYMVEVGDNEQQSGTYRLRNVTEHREEGNGYEIKQLIETLAKA